MPPKVKAQVGLSKSQAVASVDSQDKGVLLGITGEGGSLSSQLLVTTKACLS